MPAKKKRRTSTTSDELASSMGPKDAVDLFVPIADASTCRTFASKQITSAVLQHLKKSGYVKCALTHTVYGRPKAPDDLANNAIPKSLYSKATIRVFRRLHVIVESMADVGLFSSGGQSPIASLLKDYDIISLAPRNSATLDAACRAQVDIVTMDYYSTQTTPFRWKRHDILQLVRNGTRFEIPYAPALLDTKARRNLMILCNEAVATAPNILLSSGPRISNDDDVGPQALRRPGDMLNFAHVVMGLAARSLQSAMSGNLQRCKPEQNSFSSAATKVKDAHVVKTETSIPPLEATEEINTTKEVKFEASDGVTDSSQTKRTEGEEEGGDDDGFIAF